MHKLSSINFYSALHYSLTVNSQSRHYIKLWCCQLIMPSLSSRANNMQGLSIKQCFQQFCPFDPHVFDPFWISHISRAWCSFCQGEKQNGGRREATWCFVDVCNEKAYFVSLFGNKIDQNRHKLHITHSLVNITPLLIVLLFGNYSCNESKLSSGLFGLFHFSNNRLVEIWKCVSNKLQYVIDIWKLALH